MHFYRPLFSPTYKKICIIKMVLLYLRYARLFLFGHSYKPKKEVCLITAQTINIYNLPVKQQYLKKSPKNLILTYIAGLLYN